MHKITTAPIISTLEDLQGEKRTKEDLKSFLEGVPSRLPINIEHDMSHATTGYIENFRIAPVPNADGEWMLTGDLYLSELPTGDLPLRGMSFSFTEPISKNTPGEEEFHVYLPFPQYNDDNLMNRLHKVDVPIAVGRWHKKGLSPEAVGFIIGITYFVLGPEWTHVYEERIRPKLLKLIGHLKKEDGIAYDYHQLVERQDGGKVRLIFVSNHSNWTVSLKPDCIRRGMAVAVDFLTSSDFAACKPVSQLRLKYTPENQSYKVTLVQYEDGEHITMG